MPNMQNQYEESMKKALIFANNFLMLWY